MRVVRSSQAQLSSTRCALPKTMAAFDATDSSLANAATYHDSPPSLTFTDISSDASQVGLLMYGNNPRDSLNTDRYIHSPSWHGPAATEM